MHLARLGASLCVIGPGYICSVMDAQEGKAVMAKLISEGEQQGVRVDCHQEE